MIKIRLEVYMPAAKRRLDELCAEKNAAMPQREVKRVVNGEEKTYMRNTKMVSDGAQNTAKVLIHTYAKRVREMKQLLPDHLDTDEVPSIRMNGERMARLRGSICSRTVRNHIKELRAAGVITEVKFHGSKHDYELWLNPEVLYGTEGIPKLTKNVDVTEVPSFSFDAINGTNFPDRQKWKLIETKNTTISKKEISPLNGNFNGNPDSQGGYEPLQVGKMETEGGAAAAVNVDKYVEKPVNRWNTTQFGTEYDRMHGFYRKEIMDFWKYAAKSLWPDRKWSPIETLRVADTLAVSIYRPIIDVEESRRFTKDEFRAWQEELYKAVNVAKKYYQDHPEYYPGLPFTAGSTLGYFDLDNPKGFKVARTWRMKNKAQNREDYGNRMINTALRHLRNHQIGKAPKRFQHRSYDDVMQFYWMKMQNFSKEQIVEFMRRAGVR